MRGLRTIHRAMPAALLAALAAGAGFQAAAAEVPEGLPAGPWILAPYLVAGYEYDTNPLFLQGETRSDRVAIATPGLGAYLPVGNSLFRVELEQTLYEYDLLDLDDNEVTESGVGMALAFSSSDTLDLSFDRTSGLARSVEAFDGGGEAVFRGDTFDLNRSAAELERAVYGRFGYRVRLERKDLVFDQGTTANFFNYRGWAYAGEFRVPAAPRQWVIGSLEGRRFDHYRIQDDPGLVFRREDSRMAYAGLEGEFARRWYTRIRAGFGDFRYPGAAGSGHEGLVADLTARYRSPGERLVIRVSAASRPYSSFFFNNTHYVHNSADFVAEYAIRPGVMIALRANIGRSTYGDALVNPGDPQEGILRRDRTAGLELSGRVELVRRIGLTVSARSARRSSNYEGVDYDSNRVFGGIAVGWR